MGGGGGGGGGGGDERRNFGRGWGKNIQSYLFKYCRGWPVPLGNLCSIFFSGVGMSRHFSGMGGWKNIQTYFCLYTSTGEYIWPAPLGNLCSFFFFHVYLVFLGDWTRISPCHERFIWNLLNAVLLFKFNASPIDTLTEYEPLTRKDVFMVSDQVVLKLAYSAT